jgi:hypothetical protein
VRLNAVNVPIGKLDREPSKHTAEGHSGANQQESTPQHLHENVRPLRTHGDPNADFAGALGHYKSEKPIKSDGGDQLSEASEACAEYRVL